MFQNPLIIGGTIIMAGTIIWPPAVNKHQYPYPISIYQKMTKIKVLRMGLPGSQSVSQPRGIILTPSRASQRPYNAVSEKNRKYYILSNFPIKSLLTPLRAPPKALILLIMHIHIQYPYPYYY